MITRPSSSWRVNDVVAYDAMRDTADALSAALLDRAATQDTYTATMLRAEATQVQRAADAVDGFDRAAVDAHTVDILERLAQVNTP